MENVLLVFMITDASPEGEMTKMVPKAGHNIHLNDEMGPVKPALIKVLQQ